MKKSFLFIVAAIMLAACGSNKSSESKNITLDEVFKKVDVAVFYFHGKMRCPACLAVQDVTNQAVAERFAGNDKVKFFEIDVSERANKDFADKYEVYSSSLVVATANEEVFLTFEGFDYAEVDPERLKDIIEKEVERLLNN